MYDRGITDIKALEAGHVLPAGRSVRLFLVITPPEVTTVTDSTDAQGQDPNADAGQDPTTNESGKGGQDSQPTGFDALPPETQKEIRALRKESASYRKRAEEYENANKTELQKRDDALKAADARATAAEQRLRDANARSAVTDAATKANATSTRAVYHLIRSDLEFDDETGEPTNVAALLKGAQRDEPSLFRASNGSGDGGAGGDPNAKPDLNALLRQSMRR